MSKPYRGKSIRELVSRGRGTCPVCSRENTKILYEMEVGEGDAKKKIKVCKICRAAIKHGKKTVPVA
jgi:RNA polymerase subunit RPABC4/transcription elongation factor Spt4